MDENAINVAERWWQSMMLSPERLTQLKFKPAPTVFKAQLKRCDNAEAAMMTEGFRALWFNLPKELTAAATERDMECWATISAALVHVQPGADRNLAAAAGRNSDSGKPTVSPLRFAQLQAADSSDELLRRLRRVLKQVKGQVSPASLVKDINQWFEEHYSFFPRRADNRLAVRWAMDYYGAAELTKK